MLYADTDSVFLLYKDRKDVLEFMNSVNASLPQKMELELEGFYTRGVFVSKKGAEERGAKKKYALLGEDGRIKIRGFELVGGTGRASPRRPSCRCSRPYSRRAARRRP